MDGWTDRYVDREIYPLPLHGSCGRQTSKMAPRIATSWYSHPCITHLLWVCMDHHSKLFKIWIQKSSRMLYFQLKIAKLTNHCDFLPSDLYSLSLLPFHVLVLVNPDVIFPPQRCPMERPLGKELKEAWPQTMRNWGPRPTWVQQPHEWARKQILPG